jgi:hypothetical protein
MDLRKFVSSSVLWCSFVHSLICTSMHVDCGCVIAARVLVGESVTFNYFAVPLRELQMLKNVICVLNTKWI